MTTVTLEDAIRAVGAASFVKGGKRHLCPVCGEWHLTLKAGDKGASFVAYCFTPGCTPFDAIMDRINSGIVTKPAPPPATSGGSKQPNKASGPGLNVAQYAEAKKLPEHWLRDFFLLCDDSRDGVPCVSFPYLNWAPTASASDLYTTNGPDDWNGENLKDRWRLAATKEDPGRKWRAGAKANLYGQFQLAYNEADGDKRAKCVFIVEGESDTQTLSMLGYPVLGVSGTKGWKPEYGQHPLLKGRLVIVLMEAGDDALQLTQTIANSFPPGHVKYIDLGQFEGFGDRATLDANALWLRCLDNSFDDFDNAAKEFDDSIKWLLWEATYAMPNDLPKTTTELNKRLAQWGNGWAPLPETATKTISITMGDQIEMKAIEWLWQDRWPRRFGMLYGMPDVGKSTITADIVARVTTGREMPYRPSTLPGPAAVLMLVSEDGLSDTVKPRLVAAGADMTKVGFVGQTKIQEGTSVTARQFDLDNDIAALRVELAKMKANGLDVQLIVIDPASSYLGELDANKAKEIRPLLLRIRDFAEELNICVLGLAHFNKNNEQAALHRLSGAGAWTEIPRFVWACIHAPTEEGAPENPDVDVRLLLNGKLNLVKKKMKSGLSYDTKEVFVPIGGKQVGFPTIDWLSDDAGITLTEAMGNAQRGPKATVAPKCQTWLANLLDNGEPMPSGDQGGGTPGTIYALAKAAGFEFKQVLAAKKALGVKHWRPADGPYVWAKADSPFGPQPAPTAPAETTPY